MTGRPCPVEHNGKLDHEWTQKDFDSFKKSVKSDCEDMGDCLHSRFLMSLIGMVRNRRGDLK